MTISTSRMFAWLRPGWRRENGNSAIEFALLFPAFITLFLVVVETGVMMTRGVMLDRAVDMSMRSLRLGTLNPMTHDSLKTNICTNSVVIPDCENVLLLELRPISTTTWEPLTNDVTCVDRTEDIQPVLEFDAGASNEMMLVRVCAVFDPFFPTTGLAAQLNLDDSGAYALVSTSAYVNEP
jgi:hypothetical protein